MSKSIVLVASLSLLVGVASEGLRGVSHASPRAEVGPGEPGKSQPKLLKITATVDGSGRMIFTRQGLRYEHRTWAPPTNVALDGEPWTNLGQTPPTWRELADRLDLTRARISERRSRDVVALELTPDGFDLYLCDSLSGASPVEVTIAIPRRD